MANKQKSKRSWKTDLKMIVRGYNLVYQASPGYMVWQTIAAISSQIMPYFALYMSSLLVNAVIARESFEQLLFLALVTVIGTLVIQIVKRVIDCQFERYDKNAWQNIEVLFLKAQCRMQFKHFDDPETALMRQRIRNVSNHGGHGLHALMYCYGDVISVLVNVIASVSLTLSILQTVPNVTHGGFLGFVNSPWSALILVGLIMLTLAAKVISVFRFMPQVTSLWSEQGMRFALSNRYVQLYFPDAWVFDSHSLSLARNKNVLLTEEYQKKIYHNMMWNQTMMSVSTVALNIGLAIYVAAKVFIGAFGIGNFVLYRGTVERFVNAVARLGELIASLRQNNEYLEEVFRFFDLPDEMYRGTLAVEKRDDNQFEIEFRNVSFRYPGCDTYALKDVSFKFRIGEKLAFVGMNGSGKTTFIKLLCRLYDPTEGTILLNGIDITRYKFDEYLALFSVVFQDFYLFHFSLAENVACSLEYDRERVTQVLERVGYGDRLRQLEKGLDTCCGKLYDVEGVETSTGEAQKIALARALYKDAPFFILDEPTASLDPIAEAEVYARFNEIVSDKTAIFISHRLSSCRFCDHIVVFDEGRLVQYGNHDELIADACGKYAELWTAQAQYYTA